MKHLLLTVGIILIFSDAPAIWVGVGVACFVAGILGGTMTIRNGRYTR